MLTYRCHGPHGPWHPLRTWCCTSIWTPALLADRRPMLWRLGLGPWRVEPVAVVRCAPWIWPPKNHKSSNGGFGWIWQDVQKLNVTFLSDESPSGSRSSVGCGLAWTQWIPMNCSDFLFSVALQVFNQEFHFFWYLDDRSNVTSFCSTWHAQLEEVVAAMIHLQVSAGIHIFLCWSQRWANSRTRFDAVCIWIS